jgi:hypothetical protein
MGQLELLWPQIVAFLEPLPPGLRPIIPRLRCSRRLFARPQNSSFRIEILETPTPRPTIVAAEHKSIFAILRMQVIPIATLHAAFLPNDSGSLPLHLSDRRYDYGRGLINYILEVGS